jgi:hypothetical protein
MPLVLVGLMKVLLLFQTMYNLLEKIIIVRLRRIVELNQLVQKQV